MSHRAQRGFEPLPHRQTRSNLYGWALFAIWWFRNPRPPSPRVLSATLRTFPVVLPAARPEGLRTVRPFGAIPPTALRLRAPPAHEPRAATPSEAHPGRAPEVIQVQPPGAFGPRPACMAAPCFHRMASPSSPESFWREILGRTSGYLRNGSAMTGKVLIISQFVFYPP